LKTGAQDAILPHNPWLVSGVPKSVWHCALACPSAPQLGIGSATRYNFILFVFLERIDVN
jgi:hypothetical protein